VGAGVAPTLGKDQDEVKSWLASPDDTPGVERLRQLG
jgi:hypothetical protein